MKDTQPPGVFKYLGIGLQLAVTILLGFLIGYIVDKKFGTLPWLTLLCSALGLGAGFYNVLKQLEKNGN